ncbi:Polysaccharide biosynthesis protein [Nostoc sp. NIES-3756]|uniref:lipopolysaccharide biosynthesis protein n=1 Tax=Nostoc sp. NIES-3756 TaxID=1751286 RepID=UPI000720367D|nr:lipopolysaccharide biosynthesis protein [Nostoc sp. NIES-3756]BAT54332.1 Polysaccharide biosynthesis protein [Nostoc sp. NIES-3756]
MLIQKIKEQLSSQFIRNVSWLGTAELVNRVFRLGTTVTLARTFDSQDYGAMALIYTIFEFANVFSLRGGIGSKIIQADEKELPIICNTSFWLNLILCVVIFVFQCAAAFPIAQFYGNQQLALPICTLAIVYLLYPVFMVNSALIERNNRLKIIAICNATQAFVGNGVTVILAILGMGVWAVVLPIVFSTPIWIFITWINNSWRPPSKFSLEKWREVFNFGKNMLAVEFLNKIRNNLDYLIVGRFLGPAQLGIYFFAFNSGSGISMNVINTFMSALYPYICAVREDRVELKKRYISSVKKVLSFVIPLILAQSILAPIYVPIIFGDKWKSAIPILIIICLSVILRVFGWANSLLLNAVDKTHINLNLNFIFTVLFAATILLTVQWGILWVAVGILVIHIIYVPISVIWSYKYVFDKQKHSLSQV